MSVRTFLISAALLLSALASIGAITHRGVPRVIATNLENLPMEIGGYIGTESRFPQSVYDALNADLHVYRVYRNDRGDWLDLYIGYYGTAKGGRTGHNPYACFPSSGWGIIETGTVQLSGSQGAKKADVNYMLTKKDGVFLNVLHWYQSDADKVLDTGFKQNLQRFVGRVLRNKNDGAFVRISTEAKESGVEAAKVRIMAFGEDILALLPQFWPEEK
jgi:EpsI family protein